ncbi:MAG: sulfate/molybdate ABC transporter ATP-binding protein [Deltaproteobacteria bacterium]|nr:MAG: sulfate/molybdate ABC transporter ATP-binding protein [Deltaproteobacteria bacterium]
MSIEVRNISKTFGAFTALNDVSLNVPNGQLVALLGPSGSGKTTLLRIIAGLEPPDAGSGRILFHDEDVVDRGVGDRQVGFVFQHYALFRHMTVFENIAFGLRVRPRKTRPEKSAIRDRVQELLRLVQLEGLGGRFPSQLSGGQRQRVALARALAVEPKVLLLDEPFGALDAKVRSELRRWLRRLHDEIHVTSVFVTHDQEEALEVADQVVVMNQGRIEQVGPPAEVYDNPANPFVYGFLGNVNLFHGRIDGGQARVGNVDFPLPALQAAGSRELVGYVRPHDIEVSREQTGPDAIAAVIGHIHGAGGLPRLELERLDNHLQVEAELTRDRLRELALQVGDRVYIRPKSMRVFVEGQPLDYQI